MDRSEDSPGAAQPLFVRQHVELQTIALFWPKEAINSHVPLLKMGRKGTQ